MTTPTYYKSWLKQKDGSKRGKINALLQNYLSHGHLRWDLKAWSPLKFVALEIEIQWQPQAPKRQRRLGCDMFVLRMWRSMLLCSVAPSRLSPSRVAILWTCQAELCLLLKVNFAFGLVGWFFSSPSTIGQEVAVVPFNGHSVGSQRSPAFWKYNEAVVYRSFRKRPRLSIPWVLLVYREKPSKPHLKESTKKTCVHSPVHKGKWFTCAGKDIDSDHLFREDLGILHGAGSRKKATGGWNSEQPAKFSILGLSSWASVLPQQQMLTTIQAATRTQSKEVVTANPKFTKTKTRSGFLPRILNSSSVTDKLCRSSHNLPF